MMFPTFDPSISLGAIAQIVIFASGGLWFIAKMNTSIALLKSDIGMMQIEIGKIGDVLIKLAVTDTRLSNLEIDVREMRHGHGFVSGPRGVDREFP